VLGVVGSVDSVVLDRSVSEGENSSGKSVILSGTYTAVHTAEQVSLTVKLCDKSLYSRAQREYSVMARLHKSDPGRFVRPFALLDGAQGGKGALPQIGQRTLYSVHSVCALLWRKVSSI
jgi:hypothetical protein